MPQPAAALAREPRLVGDGAQVPARPSVAQTVGERGEVRGSPESGWFAIAPLVLAVAALRWLGELTVVDVHVREVLHVVLLAQEARAGVFHEPARGAEILDDLEGALHDAVGEVQVARPRGERDGELGARDTEGDDLEVARGKGGAVVPGEDVGDNVGIEATLQVERRNGVPVAFEDAADGSGPRARDRSFVRSFVRWRRTIAAEKRSSIRGRMSVVTVIMSPSLPPVPPSGESISSHVGIRNPLRGGWR